MNNIRKQILAAFGGGSPAPTSLFDFTSRSLPLKGLARLMVDQNAKRDDDLDAGKLYEMSALEEALETEAQAMLASGLLMQSKLNDLDHWKPPPGVYQLTPRGATAALAVLKEIRAGEQAT